MAKIKLSPEQLLAQSVEMMNLQKEYESLFGQVTSILNGMNGCWSETMAGNFSGKIQSAQKSFSSIANMLLNGASAARISSQTFNDPGSVLQLAETGTGDFNFSTLDALSKILYGADGTSMAEILGEVTGGKVDKDLLSAIEKMTGGDYSDISKYIGDKGIDWVAENLCTGMSPDSWVSILNEETGGTLGLDGLEKAFYKNWIGSTLGSAGEIVNEMYFGDDNPMTELQLLGEMAWNATGGSVIQTAADASYDVVSNIPGIGDWYAEKGATDSVSMVGVALGEMSYAMTGNEEDAAYVKNYYSDHGGFTKGIVDGIVDIGGYAAEKLGPVLGNAWNCIVGK